MNNGPVKFMLDPGAGAFGKYVCRIEGTACRSSGISWRRRAGAEVCMPLPSLKMGSVGPWRVADMGRVDQSRQVLQRPGKDVSCKRREGGHVQTPLEQRYPTPLHE